MKGAWLLLPLLIAACGSSGGSDNGSSGSSGTSGTSGATSGGPSDTTNPASTACNGLVACGADCVTLDYDNRHCGACGNACAAGSVCLGATCKPGTCADVYREACGSSCVLTDDNPLHCGACNKACTGNTTCYKGACVNVFGTGASCNDPIVMPGGGANVDVYFTFADAKETQLLSCGEPTARPRKVFRFTSSKTKDNARFEVRYGLASNDLVLEVFTDAPCEKAQSLGCNDDDPTQGNGGLRPELEVPIVTGKTYFIVVSSKGPPPAGLFSMHFDD